MLRFETNNGEVEVLAVSGNTIDIVSDTMFMIRLIYDHLNDETKEVFRKMITESIYVAFLPADEIVNETKKKAKEVGNMDELIMALDELNKTLDDLIGKDKKEKKGETVSLQA